MSIIGEKWEYNRYIAEKGTQKSLQSQHEESTAHNPAINRSPREAAVQHRSQPRCPLKSTHVVKLICRSSPSSNHLNDLQETIFRSLSPHEQLGKQGELVLKYFPRETGRRYGPAQDAKELSRDVARATSEEERESGAAGQRARRRPEKVTAQRAAKPRGRAALSSISIQTDEQRGDAVTRSSSPFRIRPDTVILKTVPTR